MQIFRDVRANTDVPANQSLTSIDLGAEAVRAAISQFRDKSSCIVSLAELRPDEDDRCWLEKWVADLGLTTARISLRPHGYDADFGLLSLFAFAERCRAEGNEGEVYISATALPWRPQTREFLFPGGRSPLQSLKEAIELAARTERLRHVFDDPDRQRWFATVSLQHGFTFRGAAASLPQWLAGTNRPRVIEDLLGLGEPELASASFRELWSALEDGDGRLDELLQESPWVRPEWARELAQAARRPRPARVGGPDRSSSAPGGPTEPSPQGAASCHVVRSVRLEWPPGTPPRFIVHAFMPVGDLGGLVRLLADGQELACWAQQPQGEYALIRQVQSLCPADCPADVLFEWVDGSGETVNAQVVAVWSADEEVAAWDDRGGAVDAWEHVFAETRAVCLLAREDLRPSVVESTEVAAGPPGFHLLRVAAGAIPQFALTLDGETLWAPRIRDGASPADGVQVFTPRDEFDPRIDPRVWIHVACDPGWLVRWVRVAGRTFPVERDCGRSAVVGPVNVLDLPRPWSLPCVVGLRGPTGTAYTLRRSLALRPCGLYRDDGGVWRIADLRAEVSSAALSRPTRIVPPENGAADGRPWAVLAGDLFVGRPADEPAPLRGLAARGESIRLCRGPYNRPACERDVLIGGAVVDPGVVKSALCRGEVVLRLDRGIMPQPEHAVYLLYTDGIRVATPRDIEVSGDGQRWAVQWADGFAGFDFHDPVAVAIGYRGRRLGAWWCDDWPRRLLAVVTHSPHPMDAGVVAAALRWYKFPVLSEVEAIRAFAAAHPLTCVRSWLLATEHPELLGSAEAPTPLDEDASCGWHMAVQTLLRDWWPTPPEADALVRETLPAPEERTDSKLFLGRLFEVFRYTPLILGRILIAAAAHNQQIYPLLRGALTLGQRRELEPFFEDVCRWTVEYGICRNGSGGWREENLVIGLMNDSTLREAITRRVCEAVADRRLRYEDILDQGRVQ